MISVTPGTYDFIVLAVSDSDATIQAQYTLHIEVTDPCLSATVNYTGQTTNPADYLYDGTASFTASYQATETLCDVEYSCIGPPAFCPQDGSTVVQFDTSTGQWQFSTTDQVTYQPGSYEITIEGKIISNPGSVDSHAFQLNLVDPCSIATVTASGQVDPIDHTYFESTSSTATFTVSDSSCSLEYDCTPAAGTDLCVLGTMDADSGELEFVLSTDDKTTYPPGTYQVDIKASVSEYPDQSGTHTFTYNFIDLCKHGPLSIPATNPQLLIDTYLLTDPSLMQTWELDSNLVEIDPLLDCGEFTIDFNQSKDSGSVEPLDTDLFTVDHEAKSITVQSDDETKAGTYIISYKASLIEDPTVEVTNPEYHTFFIEA